MSAQPIMKHRNSKLSRYGLKKILFRHNIGRRLKQVTEKLDGVAAEREKFHLREFAAIQKPTEVAATRETGSVLSEPQHIYGREDDKQKIVDILVQENKEISVLPVIGVGGLGKTTLAQLVFNDQRVVDHFDTKLWVCVSDNFDVKDLIKAMIESATGTGCASDLQHLDSLQRQLRELLNHKRYFLVFDDVWNEHQHKWSELRNILACGSAGTSVIVTTRLKMVADIMGTLPNHYLTGLSEEHCWMLLKQCAFSRDRELRVLEQGLRCLKSLTLLEIRRSLPEGWLRHLTALKTLIVRECQELVELPDEMRHLQVVGLSGGPTQRLTTPLLSSTTVHNKADFTPRLATTSYFSSIPQLVRLPTACTTSHVYPRDQEMGWKPVMI